MTVTVACSSSVLTAGGGWTLAAARPEVSFNYIQQTNVRVSPSRRWNSGTHYTGSSCTVFTTVLTALASYTTTPKAIASQSQHPQIERNQGGKLAEDSFGWSATQIERH